MTKSSFPLPQDWRDAVLVGRIDMGEGPTPVLYRNDDTRITVGVAVFLLARRQSGWRWHQNLR